MNDNSLQQLAPKNRFFFTKSFLWERSSKKAFQDSQLPMKPSSALHSLMIRLRLTPTPILLLLKKTTTKMRPPPTVRP